MRINRRRSNIPATILVILLCSSVAVAVADNNNLDKRITLKLEEAPLQSVFDTYKKILGVELDVDPTLGEKITISFENITVRTSLNAICESAGCRWELSAGDPDLLRIDRDDWAAGQGAEQRSGPNLERNGGGKHLESPVTLNLDAASATSVLELTAQLIGAQLLLDTDLAGRTISINVSDVPLSTVLDTMCADLGCVWNLREGNPPALEVYNP